MIDRDPFRFAALAALLSLAAATGLLGEGPKAASLGAVDSVRLDNGMWVTLANPRRPPLLTEVLLVVRAGTEHEPAQPPELAWLSAEALFAGPMKSGEETIRHFLARSGILWDLTVGKEVAIFRFSVPRRQTFPFLRFLAQRLALEELPTAAWAEAVERRQRALIGEQGNLWESSTALLKSLSWEGVEAPRPAHLRLAALPDAREASRTEFRALAYAPSRMVLSVWGDFPLEMAREAVGRLFGRLAGRREGGPQALPSHEEANPVPTSRSLIRCLEAEAARPAVLLVGVGAPAVDEADFYGLQVLAQILGAGHGSRLHRRLRLEESLVYTVEASCLPVGSHGLTLQVVAQTDRVERVRQILLEEITRLSEEAVEVEEMEVGRALLTSRLLLDHESLRDRFYRQALGVLLPDIPQRSPEGAERVLAELTPTSLQATAQRTLRPGHAVTLIVADRPLTLCAEEAEEHPQATPTSPPLGLPPVPVPEDNPQTAAKVALGERLFFEPGLSADGTVHCASCHRPEHYFADTVPLSRGVGGTLGPRNTPSILNSAYAPRLLGDGRSFSLEDQVRYPVTHEQEMQTTPEAVVEFLSNHPTYPALFAEVFGEGGITFERVSQALACFERTLLSGNAPFDRHIFEGEQEALSPAAKRGWEIFRGKAGCIQCHHFAPEAPFFTDHLYHNTGITWDTDKPDLGRYLVTKAREDKGRHRTPSLRNVAGTAPYMHDGRFQTLEEVVEFYAAGGIDNFYLDELVRPLDLSREERSDLVAFLGALTGETRTPPPVGERSAELSGGE